MCANNMNIKFIAKTQSMCSNNMRWSLKIKHIEKLGYTYVITYNIFNSILQYLQKDSDNYLTIANNNLKHILQLYPYTNCYIIRQQI